MNNPLFAFIVIPVVLFACFLFYKGGIMEQKSKPQRVWVKFQSINSDSDKGMMFSDYLKDGSMQFLVDDTGLRVQVFVETIEK